MSPLIGSDIPPRDAMPYGRPPSFATNVGQIGLTLPSDVGQRRSHEKSEHMPIGAQRLTWHRPTSGYADSLPRQSGQRIFEDCKQPRSHDTAPRSSRKPVLLIGLHYGSACRTTHRKVA